MNRTNVSPSPNHLEENRGCRLREVAHREKENFNRFMRDSPLGSFYQTYEWGDLKKSSGWTPIRLVLENNERILGAATVLKRSNAGLTMLYSPRGPVLDYNCPETLRLFCRGMIPLAHRERASFWRIDPELTGAHYADLFTKTGLRAAPANRPFGGIQPRWVWRIPLSQDPEAQWSALKKGCRRQITRAKHSGVEIREGGLKELPDFYQLLQDTAKHDGFRIRQISYFENLWRFLIPGHTVKLYLAYYRDKPVSTALVIGFGRGVWDIYAGNSSTERKLGASYYLTWELLKWACEEGYSFYDLGGIAPLTEIKSPREAEKDPLAGLRFFKSRFGGEDVEFAGEFDMVFNPAAYRFWHWGQEGMKLLPKLLSLCYGKPF
jgi:peptidoglycan pentaglycine glycine transferase (the first glycine)